MKINLMEDLMLSWGEEKISHNIYANPDATIEFEGMDEITIDLKKYSSTLFFNNYGYFDGGNLKLPDTFPLQPNFLALMNNNILEFTHTIDCDAGGCDSIKKMLHGQTFEFEYIFK